MQIIENWADVEGKVGAVEPHPELDGYAKTTVVIEKVSPVQGFANLFSSAPGQQTAVNIDSSKVEALGLVPGANVRMRIRKAGPLSVFADPDSITRL